MKRPKEVIDGLTVVLNKLETEHGEDLTEWEQGFVSDMVSNVEKFGMNVWLSDKQLGRVKEIAERFGL